VFFSEGPKIVTFQDVTVERRFLIYYYSFFLCYDFFLTSEKPLSVTRDKRDSKRKLLVINELIVSRAPKKPRDSA
jgi:hypothetical protein